MRRIHPSPSTQLSGITPEQALLERLLHAPCVEAAWFSSHFLDAVPLSRVQAIVSSLQQTYGPFQRARPIGGGFALEFDRPWSGTVTLQLNDAGQFDLLLFESRQPALVRVFATLQRRYPAATPVVLLGSILGIPLLWIVQLWQSANRIEWLGAALALAVMLSWAYLVYPWTFVTYWLRYALPAGVAVAVASRLPPFARLSWGTEHLTVTDGLNLGLVIIFGRGIALALRGRRSPQHALDLTFPLRDGAYGIVEGGGAKTINYHATHRSQRYALDIVKMDAFGRRAHGLSPRSPARYRIFDDSVYSPCDGVVLKVVANLPDLTPPDTDPTRAAGNHILLEHRGVKILLAHLRPGSILVAVGDRVRQGQPLGRVGNSGNTSEPHLHIHAERGGEPTDYNTGDGAPIVFAGRFLCRNDVVRRPTKDHLRSQ